MRHRTYHALSEINVTNLVDVVLVLLIIFMVTAPLLQSGIEVRLPQTTTAAEQPSEGIVVTIKKDGGVFIRTDKDLTDVYTAPENRERDFEQAIRTHPGAKAYIRADNEANYGLVVEIIGIMKAHGVNDVGLVTQPKMEKPEQTQPPNKWG